MSITTASAAGFIGADAFDNDGEKIGKITQIWLDDQSGQPEWAAISTGFFGNKDSLAPLANATPKGSDLTFAYAKSKVKDAPRVEADDHLEPDEEDTLYDYYGMTTAPATTAAAPTEASAPAAPAPAATTTDASLTRSEEELRVGTTQREAGRARLRKYIVTEQQTVTVPVQHEEVRMVREPIEAGTTTGGTDLTEQDAELTLMEEQVVVEKKVVPKERVSLAKDVVTEQQEVTEGVRKEVVETVGGVEDTTPRP